MAKEYSIEWAGDQSFRIIFTSLSQTACFITTLYGNAFNMAEGPLNFATNSSYNIQAQQRVGLVFAPSGTGNGIFMCTGINNVAPSYIEEVFVFFGTAQEVNKRAFDIMSANTNTGSVAGTNNFIKSATWSAIVTRSQAEQLTTPSGLYADNITSDSARIGWNAVSNASGYKVEYRQSAGGGQTYPWIEAQD